MKEGDDMIMDLPENYEYWSKSGKREAYIEDGILKLETPEIYKRVVYQLTYLLNGGKHLCLYCHKEITFNKVTLDHMYPQFMGGPTITNNLLPSCLTCNNEKSNLTKSEYMEFLWLKHRDCRKAKEYQLMVDYNKEALRKAHQYEMPQSWISKKEITKIYAIFSFGEPNKESKKYQKVRDFYKNYGYFQKPIIVDINGFLLDGFYTVLYAKNNNIRIIPVIQLENVEVI